jgi:hypothetical protein
VEPNDSLLCYLAERFRFSPNERNKFRATANEILADPVAEGICRLIGEEMKFET